MWQARFARAMELVGSEFVDKLQYFYQSWLPARSIVQDAFNARFEVRHEVAHVPRDFLYIKFI